MNIVDRIDNDRYFLPKGYIKYSGKARIIDRRYIKGELRNSGKFKFGCLRFASSKYWKNPLLRSVYENRLKVNSIINVNIEGNIIAKIDASFYMLPPSYDVYFLKVGEGDIVAVSSLGLKFL